MKKKSGVLKKIILVGVIIGITLSVPVKSLAQENFGERTTKQAIYDFFVTTPSQFWTKKAKDTKDWAQGEYEAVSKVAQETIAQTTFLAFIARMLHAAAKIDPFDNAATRGSIQDAIQEGNSFLLNLMNLFYIFILLLIAVATILDIQRYKASRLLPKLVIAILLSNFGLFAVVAISNFSQILASGLLGADPVKTLVSPIIGSIGTVKYLTTTALKIILAPIVVITGPGSWLIALFVELLNPMNYFLIAFILATLILLFRIAGLWMLAIAAPAGVAAGVLPATQGFAKLYWRKVISYAFVAPILIFFIRMAVIFFGAFDNSKESVVSVPQQFAEAIGGGVFNPYNWIRDLGSVLILFIGIVVVRKMGVEVANLTIGGFEKAFKLGFKGMKLAGKAAVVAGAAVLAIPSGGTSVGALAGAEVATSVGGKLAQVGISKATRKAAGGFLKKMGSGLVKGNKTGTLSNAFGRVIEGFGSKYKSGPYKAGKIPIDFASDDTANPNKFNGVKTEYDKFEKDPILGDRLQDAFDKNENQRKKDEPQTEFANYIGQGATDDEKAARAFKGAEMGAINGDNINSVLPKVPPQYQARVRELARISDPRVDPMYKKTDSAPVKRRFYETRAQEMLNSDNAQHVSPAALEADNGQLASMLVEKATPAQKEKLETVFKPAQLTALVNALAANNRVPGKANEAYERDAKAMIEFGGDVGKIFAGTDPGRVTQNNRIIKEAAGVQTNYAHQSREGAINLINKVDDSILIGLFSKLPAQIKYALKSAAKSPASGRGAVVLSEEKRALIRHSPMIQATK